MTKPITDDRLRNVRAWAAARPDMSGSDVIVSAIDELLERRSRDEPQAPHYKPGAAMYPTTFAEQNLAGDIHIRPEDIASYAHAPGRRERYTFAGWGKAVDLGIAVIDLSENRGENQ
jgi:hypothetical protein